MKTVLFGFVVLIGAFVLLAATYMAASYNAPNRPNTSGPAWWSDRTAGLVGGFGGAILGMLGGLIGVLTSMGKARSLAIGLAWGMLALGVVSIPLGLAAILMRQPYAVYYPLLLTGLILTLVIGLNLRTIQARYRELELTRMRVQDAADQGRGGI